MERVQYQLEASIPELKDLQSHGIFSSQEIKEIIKRRSHFETQLVRRQPRKKDFLEYIEYEMALERLRKRRAERLKTPLPHSLSSHSIIQRQFSIFERATRKFKGDLRLWVQYIEVAKREGATNLVSRVVARALQLHPSSISLYILAAQHELDQGSPSASRNILQRGIRLNRESVDLWCEYVKMELGWCEFLRRRWETLGIKAVGKPLSSVPATEDLEKMNVESTRREVLDGAIVKEVLRDALTAQHTTKAFYALRDTLGNYPTNLATSLVPFLYSLLLEVPPFSDVAQAEVKAIYASRHFESLKLNGPDGVKGLKLANEELLEACQNASTGSSAGATGNDRILQAYASFIWAQWQSQSDPNVRLYLASSLHNLCQSTITSSQTTPTKQPLKTDEVYSTHLRILLDPTYPPPSPTPQKILKLARKYTLYSSNPSVWLRRLEAEDRASPSSQGIRREVQDTARQARMVCRGDGVEKLWTWGWDALSLSERESLLKETFSLPSNPQTMSLQNTLFLQLLSSIYNPSSSSNSSSDSPKTATARSHLVRRLIHTYLPKPIIYQHAFGLEISLPPQPSSAKDDDPGYSHRPLIESIFRLWVDAPGPDTDLNRAEATFAYAKYMLSMGEIKGANRLVAGLLARSGKERYDLERKWEKIVDELQEGDPHQSDDEDEVMRDNEADDQSQEDGDVELMVSS